MLLTRSKSVKVTSHLPLHIHSHGHLEHQLVRLIRIECQISSEIALDLSCIPLQALYIHSTLILKNNHSKNGMPNLSKMSSNMLKICLIKTYWFLLKILLNTAPSLKIFSNSINQPSLLVEVVLVRLC